MTTIAPGLFLFSTTDLKAARDIELERMFASVERFAREVPDCPVRLLFLLQNAQDKDLAALPPWVEGFTCDRLISLSAARNRLLSKVDLAAAGGSAVAAFPDDDAWYPDGSLDFMRRLIADSDTVDLALCRYGTDAGSPRQSTQAKGASLQQALSFGSSNTIFLRASLAASLEGFDEGLGLGTPSGSGEDTDYVMRAWHKARRSVFVNEMLVCHRDNDPSIKACYFEGSLAAIGKNKTLSPWARVAHLRKLGVGASRKFISLFARA